ncbi:vitamin K epoxide reductase complex subunit 1-like [Penaeus chinensis]|uniref:vitamin K epoxide reductase complex subunit 1-like n=1 Tax=Penaeus chinensis TaxID=139456 RepID=UPI001FB78EF6|nr:vitamin K epoxide reductase complex subunit 1-like [Penaeus chinensis]
MAKGDIARTLSQIRLRMMVLCLLGVALSLYALYVEFLKEADENYEAMCDINSYISCSKVFTSKYGRGFGIVGEYLGKDHIMNQPNSIPGIMFYILILALGEIRSPTAAKIQRGLVFTSNFMSLYLAYLLYFILHDFCIVCVSTYIVNFLLTLCAFHRVSTLGKLPKRKMK